MKFDFVIGNPPYQEETQNENDRKPPVYHSFMDEAYKIGSVVELITPARFLFNAGQTPKVWNQKMLNDEHFKILEYEKDAQKVFANTEIKGGVAISIRDTGKDYGKIGTFTAYSELNSIVGKVNTVESNRDRFDTIVSSRGLYRFSDAFFKVFPYATEKVGQGTGNMIVSNIFEKIPEAFADEPYDEPCILLLGRLNNKRIQRFIRSSFVIDNEYIDKYKVIIAEANGNGQFGEVLSLPSIQKPGEGNTDTFISIGMLNSFEEAEYVLKYIKTKFARAMLGVKKATQHTPKSTWEMVPLQDFTSNSDINWSLSVSEIDQQLYKKYGLSDEEIAFIETNVKEME